MELSWTHTHTRRRWYGWACASDCLSLTRWNQSEWKIKTRFNHNRKNTAQRNKTQCNSYICCWFLLQLHRELDSISGFWCVCLFPSKKMHLLILNNKLNFYMYINRKHSWQQQSRGIANTMPNLDLNFHDGGVQQKDQLLGNGMELSISYVLFLLLPFLSPHLSFSISLVKRLVFVVDISIWIRIHIMLNDDLNKNAAII